MSVLGLGLDIVDIASFAEQLAVRGSTFAASTFTHAELAEAAASATDGSQVHRGQVDSGQVDSGQVDWGRARRLAGRFAAKEAFLKSWSAARLGRAPAMAELRWSDLEVLADPWGRPFVRPAGAAADAVVASLGDVRIHLSITHDGPVAAAVVVLSDAGAAATGSPEGSAAGSAAGSAGGSAGGSICRQGGAGR